jgi:signal peptidase I
VTPDDPRARLGVQAPPGVPPVAGNGRGDGIPRGGAPGGAEAVGTPRAGGGKKSFNRVAAEWAVLIIAAIVVAVGIKSFLFQAFYIPSESMVPTLEVGDRVLVNKLSYDLHDVNRGDIVVFAAAPNHEWQKAGIDDLVKRVIGLPGETVTQCGDHVCIDNKRLNESYLPKDIEPTQSWPSSGGPIVGCSKQSPANGCTLLAGEYFMMGDNRPASADSRLHGPIKGSSIVGRAFVRIWPLNRLGFL